MQMRVAAGSCSLDLLVFIERMEVADHGVEREMSSWV